MLTFELTKNDTNREVHAEFFKNIFVEFCIDIYYGSQPGTEYRNSHSFNVSFHAKTIDVSITQMAI